MLPGGHAELRVLKQGRFSTVVLLQDRDTGERLVSRQLHPPGALSSRNVAAVVSHLQQLSHGGVQRLREYEAGRFLSDFVVGRPVNELSPGTLQEEWIALFTWQLLDVLAYLHAQDPPLGVGGFEPGDVVLGGSGPVLVDLRLFERLYPENAGLLGVTGSSFFFAPEMRNAVVVDPRADLYSVGAVACWLLTGKDPQAGLEELRHRHVDWIDGIVAMLSPHPSLRPASARVAMQAMESALPPRERWAELSPEWHPGELAPQTRRLEAPPGFAEKLQERPGGFELYVVSGPERGRWIALTDRTVHFGRDASEAGWISLVDPSVSHRHFSLHWDAAARSWRLIHHSGTNPTLVDGVPVKESVLLHAHDVIQAGHVVLRLVVDHESEPRPRHFSRVATIELASAFRQLAVMLRAGVVLPRALEVLSGSTSEPHLRVAFHAALTAVCAGTPLSEALRRQETGFPRLAIKLIGIGEQSGNLDHVLERVAAWLERQAILRLRVQSMLIYPAFTFAVFLLLIVCIPALLAHGTLALLTDVGGRPPLLTQALLFGVGVLRNPFTWLGMAITTVGMVGAVRQATLAQRLGAERALLRMRAFGTCWRMLATSRFAAALQIMVAAGLPILPAIRTSGRASGSLVLKVEADRAADALEQGVTLDGALTATGFFPARFIHLLAAAVEAGTIDSMLALIARLALEEADTRIEQAAMALEPLLLGIMGALAGFVVLATLGPLLQITEQLSR